MLPAGHLQEIIYELLNDEMVLENSQYHVVDLWTRSSAFFRLSSRRGSSAFMVPSPAVKCCRHGLCTAVDVRRAPTQTKCSLTASSCRRRYLIKKLRERSFDTCARARDQSEFEIYFPIIVRHRPGD